jgi:hypothetical protein
MVQAFVPGTSFMSEEYFALYKIDWDSRQQKKRG